MCNSTITRRLILTDIVTTRVLPGRNIRHSYRVVVGYQIRSSRMSTVYSWQEWWLTHSALVRQKSKQNSYVISGFVTLDEKDQMRQANCVHFIRWCNAPDGVGWVTSSIDSAEQNRTLWLARLRAHTDAFMECSAYSPYTGSLLPWTESKWTKPHVRRENVVLWILLTLSR